MTMKGNKMILKGEPGTVKINILKRANYTSHDYWDANWLESNIMIEIPDFKANYKTNLRVDDLQRFYDELIELSNFNKKRAEFKTLEKGLSLECVANSRGAVLCTGKAKNQYGNCLYFEMETDIGSISSWISELRSALKKYPLVGKRT